ncbi:hypothetical protein GL4_1064 [Methyloceanibacter caenitepidi]|uniref:Uncharacterized protein n=1 Tax=Methyloceanibacter caenitepidi TaxID=1384459 RepID=A0A0A8K3F3_9HYPH|nr:hypothetical protein GL4_1064 [Methyloceanibacter caenitepidi]
MAKFLFAVTHGVPICYQSNDYLSAGRLPDKEKPKRDG